jgi:hypothetical protein
LLAKFSEFGMSVARENTKMAEESEHKQTDDAKEPLLQDSSAEAPASEEEARPESTTDAPQAAPARVERKGGGFLLGWFWQGEKAKQLRGELSNRPEPFAILLSRSRAYLSAARSFQSDGEEVEAGFNTILAEVYLGAIRWSLAALQSSKLAASEPLELDEIFTQLTLPPGTVRDDSLATYHTLRGLDAAALWEIAPTAQQVTDLERLARGAFELAERPLQELENIWFARLLRVGVPIVLLVAFGLAGGTAIYRNALLRETELPWKASSTYSGEKGCESPHQECAETRFFFCTNEQDNPWIEFDLGKGGSVSRLKVKNRVDCPSCADRAVPLVVEVSTDHKEWKEVARRTQTFEEWQATFPKEKARWVRLRALKRTFLHLQQVRISE